MSKFIHTTECECCEKPHSYPGEDYYDLCRKCAVEHEYEDGNEPDWRTQ